MRTTTARENAGIRVPDGFEVSLFADDDLAHDVYSMTIDSLGRVVVSGRGYVRILLDTDGDEKADSFRQFADGPQSGAQGMYFHGRDLLCTGDAGLIRYRDQNGDDRADGPPDVFLKIKTGGEHHAHAIRHGPDGWWYLIAGNMAEVTGSYATLRSSPIRQPSAGTLLRLKPDLAGGEIVVDGFRNAYDFAFHPLGDIFAYDSDGERDVSLPWYRPTRVFHALPGSNAGWASRSWKRPGYFADMPPVVAAFGRGSPTGVACYRHRRFPEKYRNALFVLDWTFGRVLALPLGREGSIWTSRPELFMTGVGQFGFAPTDVAVGPDGSLYVSVGGRGTRGGVFRVSYRGDTTRHPAETTPDVPDTPASKLSACLAAPQPLSSWSRAVWLPLAEQLGPKPLLAAALDKQRAPAERVRAIEILTELFAGLDADALTSLSKTAAAEVRARAVWSAGRTELTVRQPKLLLPFLNDGDPFVVRSALESLIGPVDPDGVEPLLPALAAQLGSKDRFVRQTAARVVEHLPEAARTVLARLTDDAGIQAQVTLALGRVMRQAAFNLPALQVGLTALAGDDNSDELKLEATRLIGLALGDVGPDDDVPGGSHRPPVFDGYASRLDLTPKRRMLQPVRELLTEIDATERRTRDHRSGGAASGKPSIGEQIDFEIARLLAIVESESATALESVLSRIDEDSHPVDDIHHLIVASRIHVGRTGRQRDAIAQALVALESKIAARKLNLDSNWAARIDEMYKELVRHDTALPNALLHNPEFGRPGHVVLLSEFSENDLRDVAAAFVRHIRSDRDYPWTNEVVFLLGSSNDAEHRQIVREQYESLALRGAVLIVLAMKPDAEDRGKFVDGLSSSGLEVLTACLEALSNLPASRDPDEQFVLLGLARRLGADRREYELREEVVRLLRRNMRQDFGFEFGPRGRRPQPDVIRKWTESLGSRFPEAAARAQGSAGEDAARLQRMLAEVDWSKGEAGRGRALFEKRACIQCHGGRTALGPDLAGAAKRFSRDDLFLAIALPNRDVSPRYQTTLIETTAGKVYTGLVIYESVDGLLLRNATNQTFRIEANEIEFRQVRPTSLMPTGLLKDLQPGNLADLYAYLRSLAAK